jgi:oxygen-dependent protoporphyrinogen oxidase
MPGPGQDPFDAVWRILTEPVFKGMALGALGEFRRPPRPHGLLDESVASFITRRLGSPHIANNIVSAVLHGIYAGDVNQLSARSLMGKMYHQEAVSGSIFHAGITAMKEQMVDFSRKDADLHQELAPKIRGLTSLRNASVYTFKKGIGALTEGLEASLRARHNVEIKLNHKVTSLVYNGENDVVQVRLPVCSILYLLIFHRLNHQMANLQQILIRSFQLFLDDSCQLLPQINYLLSPIPML